MEEEWQAKRDESLNIDGYDYIAFFKDKSFTGFLINTDPVEIEIGPQIRHQITQV